MDILAALPKTPGMAPEALWAWLKRNGKVHPQELIRYKTTRLADPLTGIREKYAACNCTACGESWHTTIALPGEHTRTLTPKKGRDATAKQYTARTAARRRWWHTKSALTAGPS